MLKADRVEQLAQDATIHELFAAARRRIGIVIERAGDEDWPDTQIAGLLRMQGIAEQACALLGVRL